MGDVAGQPGSRNLPDQLTRITNMPNTTNPSEDPPSPMSKKRLLVVLVQVVGFGIGIALLIWAVGVAMREENREQLSKLSDASPMEIMLLLSLAALSVGFNGIIFWTVINPIHRLRPTDVIATNAIATFMAYLPFKLSVVTRFVIHNRRDKVPVLTIGAWIIAEAILMTAVLGPLVLVSIWLKEINALWWVVSIISVIVCTTVGSAMARQLSGEIGVARLGRLGLSERITSSEAFGRVHTGIDMLGNARTTLITNAFRFTDIITFALRFYVAAQVLDLPISMQDSLLLGTTYFIIGAASPAGMLGTREAGTIAIAELVGISSGALSETESGQIPIAAAVIFVTAVEAVVNLGCAGFGIAWLKARKPLAVDGEEAQEALIEKSIGSDS
jgi:hypothetical protein